MRATLVFISGILVGLYMPGYVSAFMHAISFVARNTPGT
jgi:hypothetical protein